MFCFNYRCEQIPETSCKTHYNQECKTEKKCQSSTRKKCTKIPHETCKQVKVSFSIHFIHNAY